MAFLGVCVRRLSRLFSFRVQNRSIHSSWSKYSGANPIEEAGKLQANDKLHGYTVTSVTAVPDFDLTAVCLTHDSTGAQHLHVARNDSNNTFSVGFRTTPMDSTGVAHILEHTTLCGSKKYPVRDPFFKMLTRSLSTFMNAFTASDWTMYPFSTQNEKDYRNLLSVYLDCVFFPQLKELDFKQEGWRSEHEDPNDRNSPIVFKGVVYNEMKGCFGNSEMLFAQALQNNLYPSHTYSHVSGGIPINILDLTWENLKDFHAKHYHPSNGRFFTYGDMPLASHLQYINENVLSKFVRASPSCEVPQEPRWNRPREHLISCPPDPMTADPSKQTTVSVSFLLSPITDPYESLVLSVLSQLLVDGPASPFYEALIDSNIGSDYSPMTGYDGSTREASFSIGLHGIQEEDATHVTEIVWATLEKVASEGFPEERIKAVLHQYELGLKHQRSNFGLALISSLISAWMHDGDPVSLMQVNNSIEKFKKDLQSEEGFLQEKIRKYFLDNKHNLTLKMVPNSDYDAKLKSAEKEKLEQFVSLLSSEDKSRVYKQGLQLLHEQNSETSTECLPTLLISDVEKHLTYATLEHGFAGGVPVQYATQPTNGVTYFKAVSGLCHLPEETKIFIPLFCFVITRMGAGDLDYRQFAQQCDLYTGGLSASPYISAHHTVSHGYDQGIMFTSHCNDRHVPHMFSLWEDVFTNPNLQDTERLRTLITMLSSNLAISIADSGHRYAMMSASSGLSPAAQLTEMFSGLTQVEFLKQLATKEALSDVLNTLMSIAAEVLDSGSLRCAVNCTHDSMSFAQTAMDGFIDTLPKSRTDAPNSYTEVAGFQSTTKNTYFQMPFPVHYVGQSFRTVPFSHEDAPRLQVLAKLMGSRFLHKEIREKGGAYGSGARQEDGVFSFMSYRDPNSLTTLDVFRKCAEWACEGHYSENDVEEAKLSVFSQIDAPVSPGAKGSRIFLKGISDELHETYRKHIFGITKKDLFATADKYILNNPNSSSTVIGPNHNEQDTDLTWIIRKFAL